MAAIQDLKSVLKETLENRGTLDQIKARVRAEVFHALNDPSEARPPMSNENMLINELILEYLEYNSYKYTSSVLTAESGQPQTRLDRQFLTSELNLIEDQDSASLPLIYSLLTHFTEGKPVRPHRSSAARQQPSIRQRPSAAHNLSTRFNHGKEKRSQEESDDFEGIHEAPVLLRGERR